MPERSVAHPVPGALEGDSATDRLKGIAQHTLALFGEVAGAAAEQLGEKPPDAASALASFNALTSARAVQSLERVGEARARELLILSREPAIARIVVNEENGAARTYYIARGTPTRQPRDGSRIASYRAPIGRLASLRIGDELEVPSLSGLRSLQVVEHAALRPKLKQEGWDSLDSVVVGEGFGPFTVKSFLELLGSAEGGTEDDLLEALLAEDRAQANVIEGLRRSVVSKMALRDQPLLDRYQDKIFRLPLDARLAILGPPGTGKTTTLIKRLGLKLDPEYLDEDERQQVETSSAQRTGHSRSWIMFTPTNLLRQYVKEAFNREQVPASDLHIRTWADYRRDLARNRFGILRSATGTGSFVMKHDARTLRPETVSGRALSRHSRSRAIGEWLGERKPSPPELQTLGSGLQLQTSARRFANPVRRYFLALPLRYRRFRRERTSEQRWYAAEGFAPQDLDPLEVDLMLLATMRGMRILLADRRIGRAMVDGGHPVLSTMHDLFKNQVAVDEATDFSPIQLACIYALADPECNALVACGDFNQRITQWGSRSEEELRWAVPGIEVRPVNISYRHSRQLNELARKIALLSRPDAPEAQLPPRVDNEGVAPVLATGLSETAAIARWLAERIGEVERFARVLPSVAVLVSGEDEVVPTAEALSAALADKNLRAVACQGGNLAGQDGDVRVFDVEHIKGLEFEAVFFVGIDRLASAKPDLFDKYLYVGATRAAMYLGATTEQPELPARIASLTPRFGRVWS